jgi:hypothetical protein
MTVERKVVVSLRDIKAVVFQCVMETCGSKVSVPPDVVADIPNACPRCHREWSHTVIKNDESLSSPFTAFISSIAKIRMLNGKTAGFRILLEFDEPSR